MNRPTGRAPDPTGGTRRRRNSRVTEQLRRIRNEPIRQLRISLLLLIALAAAGTIGYTLIDDRYSILDALYMTIITLTTVGFGEVYPLGAAGKAFTIGLIVLGVGIAAWAVSNAAEVMLGEAFWSSFQRRRIREAVMRLSDHYVV